MPADALPVILRGFRDLRFMDETLDLRPGTLNVCNGMVGLIFSCHGWHRVRWSGSLDKSRSLPARRRRRRSVSSRRVPARHPFISVYGCHKKSRLLFIVFNIYH
ncbi:hypothetical protein RG903_04165 [Thermithiobacillus tepidarius DSM 3134]|uniref:hypothetical protein n=1 Tax=Thermithiobacillus tepidarius TaxID=929 RepID=UPI0012DCA7C7|nr:hypothetical protein [Thermithiobacillus tepidarius]